MIYVPNRIGIPIHGGDLGHHELRMEDKTQELSMELHTTEERRRKKGKEVTGTFYAHQSCHFIRRDLCMSCAHCSGVIEST
jgi:hypothetical protein